MSASERYLALLMFCWLACFSIQPYDTSVPFTACELLLLVARESVTSWTKIMENTGSCLEKVASEELLLAVTLVL